MINIDFSQPRRQSVKGLLLIFIQEGKRAVQLFWPVILPVLISKQSDKKLMVIGWIVLAGVVLTLIHTILYFRKFRFHIEGDLFILRKGYLNRKMLTIPLDRIQNVNTNQSVLQLKNTSLLYLVAVPDLMYATQSLTAMTYRPLECYSFVALLYFCMLYPMTVFAKRLEARRDV